MLRFAAQEPQDEQQDGNPFAVVDGPENSVTPSVEPNSTSESPSKFVPLKPVGISDDLEIRGIMPSDRDQTSTSSLLNDQVSKALSAQTNGPVSQSTQKQETTSNPVNQFELSEIHPAIWVAAVVGVAAILFWFNRKSLKRLGRSKRQRTKADTFKPVINHLKNTHNQTHSFENGLSPNGDHKFGSATIDHSERIQGDSVSNAPDAQVIHRSDKRATEQPTTVENRVRKNGQSKMRSRNGTPKGQKPGNSFSVATANSAKESSNGHPSETAILDRTREPSIDPFDGETKEVALEKAHTITQIANLTSEIASLKESLANVKLERKLQGQLQSYKTEIAKKSEQLDMILTKLEDREAALKTSVEVQTELRSKIETLTAELAKSRHHATETQDRIGQLESELAAERTAIVALHKMIETREKNLS